MRITDILNEIDSDAKVNAQLKPAGFSINTRKVLNDSDLELMYEHVPDDHEVEIKRSGAGLKITIVANEKKEVPNE